MTYFNVSHNPKRAQPWENSRGLALLVYREDPFPFILLFALTQSGTQCLSRTSGWHTMPPFAPTADAQRLSRLRRSLQKQTVNISLFSPRGKLYGSKRFALQKKKGKILHATSGKPRQNTQKGPTLGNSPGAGPSLFIGKMPSLLFCCFQSANQTHSVSRAYGGSHGSKPQLWRVPLHKGKPYVSNQPIVTAQCLTGALPGRVV